MESVGKTPENAEHALGEVLAARNAAIANAEHVPGIGPPDLCWIQRTAKGIFSTNKPKMQGYYHWVVGLPVTSTAAVSAYFARLSATAKKVGYYQGLGVGREFAIGRAIYCCYDPFSDMDIWVEIALPGGAVARGLDRAGYLHDVTADMWHGAHVGGFLRYELYDVTVTLHCDRAFQHMPFFKSHAEESELLGDVVYLYQTQSAQKALGKMQWDQGHGTEPHHMDILCNALLEHFKKHRRWQKALQFFTELELSFASSVVYLAEIYKELDNGEGAADLVRGAVQHVKNEDHPMLLLACGYVYLDEQQGVKAVKIAQTVLDAEPQLRPAWVLLSRALQCEEEYGKSLRALHLMPPPLIPSDRRVLLFRVLPPKPKFTTRRSPAYQPEASELKMEFQENQKAGILMKVLPAQVLAPRFQSHGVEWGIVSCTQSVMRVAYDLLLNCVQAIGWEQFCELRSRIFLLPSDEESVTKEWSPVNVVFVIPDTGLENPVMVTLNVEESPFWEKPRHKATHLYAHSMSVGAQSKDNDSSVVGAEHATQVATKILTRGLGAVTTKVLKVPSTSSTVLREGTEQTFSPTTVASSDMLSPSSQLETENKGSRAELPEMLVSSSETAGTKGLPKVMQERIVRETVTTAEFVSTDDEVPDAPENALPQQCPPYSLAPRPTGPPSSAGLSSDKWQVKIVSMGIKERVKYFDQMAKEKMAKQMHATARAPQFEDEACVPSMRPRRGRYSITQTIMERLIHEIPPPESTVGGPGPSDEGESSLAEEGELESSESTETPPPQADWESFALDEAAHVPQGTPGRVRISLFDGTENFAVPSELPRSIDAETPRQCAEWLDELILALWEDLAVYSKFKSLDRKLKTKNRQTHAEQILGTIEWNYETTDDDEAVRTPTAGPVIPDTRPVDWMRRGLLCERLGKFADAEQSYRVCVFLTFNLTALLALTRIYCDWGYSKGALLVLNRVAQFHQKKHSPKKSMYLPQSFVLHMSRWLESVGTKDFKASIEKNHLLLVHAMEEILKWRQRSAGPVRRGR